MRVTTDGPADGPDLVLVLGWGNRLSHQNIQWLRGQFAEAGYRVHTVELQDVIADFDREYVEPIQEYVDDLAEFRLVGHSTGGLIGPFIDGAVTETYLSPWWGYPQGSNGADEFVMSLISSIPTTRKIVPSGEGSREDIGKLATDGQFEDGDPWAAPTFFREGREAHERRPPIDENAVVFLTPRDPVVSVRAVAETVELDQIVFYDGGHEWFSSPCRTEQIETLLAAVEDGRSEL